MTVSPPTPNTMTSFLVRLAAKLSSGFFLARMVGECQGLEMTVGRVASTPQIEFAEWTSRYVVGASVPKAAGQVVSVRGVSILELAGGRCCAYSEYFDRGKALADMGIPADDVYRVLTRPTRP